MSERLSVPTVSSEASPQARAVRLTSTNVFWRVMHAFSEPTLP